MMTWKEYSLALIVTNVIVGVFVFFMLVYQNVFPSSPHMNGLSVDLAFNSAISFITNTDIGRHYSRLLKLYHTFLSYSKYQYF
jgi:potassium-transporting ATPase potassium-binding subunit